MKFQKASIKEIKRVSIGCGLCLGLMIAAFALLSALGIGRLDYRVLLSGAVGTVVAIANFAVLCLTIQKVAPMADQKRMRSRFQRSYHIRMIAQGAWAVAAFVLPCFHPVAAALPLLFPTAVIFFLRSGKRLAISGLAKGAASEQRDALQSE